MIVSELTASRRRFAEKLRATALVSFVRHDGTFRGRAAIDSCFTGLK
jgi:hypothetical protein